MRAYDIIFKKRTGIELTKEEISFMVNGYVKNTIPDYQMSAFLMAIFFKGMTPYEISLLTNEYINSGKKINFSDIPGFKVDKHSTGGVGDGISLFLTPLVADCGCIVPMISGRGLGHTGGTLDKLESISGFNVNLDELKFKKIIKEIGAAMVGQTEDFVPADKKIYSLRDVTATVDSIPLISASIMSKKIAEGIDALILDIKTGNGAFMQTVQEAEALADSMVNIGKSNGKKIQALITDMNQPLGYFIGNALEMKQTIKLLRNDKFENYPSDFVNLTKILASKMLIISGISMTEEDALKKINYSLNSGKALEKMKQIIKAQDGDLRVIDAPEKYFKPANNKMEIVYPGEDGLVEQISTKDIGISALMLGAGRETKESSVDLSAGIELKKKINDEIKKNEILGIFYFNDSKNVKLAKDKFVQAYKISDTKLKKDIKLVYKVIN